MRDSYGEEAESWYYSYDGWASRQREEAQKKNREQIESDKFLNPEKPFENGSSFMSQSFLTGEADLIEVEQMGQQIIFKIAKHGVGGQVTRLNLTPKEARTLILMLATAIEGGPYSQKDEDNFLDNCDSL